MNSLKSSRYLQLHHIDDTADQIAYLLIKRYRAQHIDGISFMKGQLYQAHLTHYGLVGFVALCGLIGLCGFYVLDSLLLCSATSLCGLGAAGMIYFSQTALTISVYKQMVQMQEFSYSILDKSLRVNNTRTVKDTPTLCDKLNELEDTVKQSAEVIKKPYKELLDMHRSQMLLA